MSGPSGAALWSSPRASLIGPGAVVAGGMVYVNVLLAFGPE